MFCPTCGTDKQTANAFCKRCGEWLPDLKSGGSLKFGGETPQQNIFTGLFMSALSTVAALLSAIALYATYLGSGDAKWSVYLAAAVCLCIAGWQASSFVVGLKLRQRLKKARETLNPIEGLPSREALPALEAVDATNFVGAPSVTENTTQHLGAKVERREA